MSIEDLNDLDVPQNAVNSEVHEELFFKEQIDDLEESIKDQYENFDNLGENYLLLFDLPAKYKTPILQNLIDYVDKNLVSIVDIENLNDGNDRIESGGTYIYEFICVDNVASLIPALMELLNITSVDDFDELVNIKYTGNAGKFKEDYLKTIQLTIEQLLKLKTITPVVANDHNYQKLLGKYYYYQEIIEHGDMEKFLNHFIRPVISKYQSSLIWKLL